MRKKRKAEDLGIPATDPDEYTRAEMRIECCRRWKAGLVIEFSDATLEYRITLRENRCICNRLDRVWLAPDEATLQRMLNLGMRRSKRTAPSARYEPQQPDAPEERQGEAAALEFALQKYEKGLITFADIDPLVERIMRMRKTPTPVQEEPFGFAAAAKKQRTPKPEPKQCDPASIVQAVANATVETPVRTVLPRLRDRLPAGRSLEAQWAAEHQAEKARLKKNPTAELNSP